MDSTEILARIVAALVAGGVIGLDRYAHGKQVGLRTLGLVSVSSAALLTGLEPLGPDAQSRVLQGIITGIGFLGAGVILHHQPDQRVKGLTTAASVWAATAAGSLCGLGAWRVAMVLTLAVAALLLAGGYIEQFVGRRRGDETRDGP